MSGTHAVALAGEARITTAADREALQIQQRKRIAASQIRLSESFPFFGALLMTADCEMLLLYWSGRGFTDRCSPLAAQVYSLQAVRSPFVGPQ